MVNKMKNKNFYNIDKNAHYFVPRSFFYPNTDHDGLVECEIVEGRYKVEDNYKVTLKPLDSLFVKYDFYQSDFYGLVKGGIIRIAD